MAAVVNNNIRYCLNIDVRHENQPNKHYLALYKLSIHFNSSLKWLYLSSKTEHFNCKGGCDVCISRLSKEEPVWLHTSGFGLLTI